MEPNLTEAFTTASPGVVKSDHPVPESGPVPEVGWSLDKGVTRENNEDSLAAVTLNQASETASQSIGVYAVADRMGGQAAGEDAGTSTESERNL